MNASSSSSGVDADGSSASDDDDDGDVEDGGGGGVEPGSMLWLIQRDFLQGQTADQLVRTVLAPVDNPQHDAGLEALNQVGVRGAGGGVEE